MGEVPNSILLLTFDSLYALPSCCVILYVYFCKYMLQSQSINEASMLAARLAVHT
jgi:hypothetical protein